MERRDELSWEPCALRSSPPTMASSPQSSSALAAVVQGITILALDDAVPNKPNNAAAAAVSLAAALPPDMLRRIFTPHNGDVRTLSAAACVCKSWHVAALDPCHWRLTCLTLAPRAARRLTDGALAALARRAGDTLERVNLAGCINVTAAGVVAALQGKQLKTLAVRGMKVGARQTKKKADATVARLHTLVCRPTALDFRKNVSCGFTCATANGETKSCKRLCGPQDVLCSMCDFVRCIHCTAWAKAKREPPCSHLCDGCFAPHNELFKCAACGRVPNGFCGACMHECSYCDVAYCKGCSFSGGALTKCADPGCDNMYCEDDQQKAKCDVCEVTFCEDCTNESMYVCDLCGNTYYCDDCVWQFIDEGDSVICVYCMSDFSDSSEVDWSDDD